MIKRALIAAGVSLAMVSTALAVPISPPAQPSQGLTSDLVQVKKYKGTKYKGKKHYKHYKGRYRYGNRYRGRYRYGNRYWGHRYSYRPRNWRGLGCIGVGGVWYCP